MPSGSNSFKHAELNSFVSRWQKAGALIAGGGWVLLVDETLDNRVPPHFLSPLWPGCRGGRGSAGGAEGARLPPAQRVVAQRGDSLGAGLPPLPADELPGKSHPCMGRENDDFIFFKGDSQFVQLLIT